MSLSKTQREIQRIEIEIIRRLADIDELRARQRDLEADQLQAMLEESADDQLDNG